MPCKQAVLSRRSEAWDTRSYLFKAVQDANAERSRGRQLLPVNEQASDRPPKLQRSVMKILRIRRTGGQLQKDTMAFSLDMNDKYMLDFEHDHGAVGCALPR